MNDPTGQSNRKAEPTPPADPVAFNPFTPFGPLFRNAAAAIDQTRGLITYTRDAVTGFTNLLNPFANSAPPVREITARGALTAIEAGRSGGAVTRQPDTAGSQTLPAGDDRPPSEAATAAVDQPPTGDSPLGALLGTMGRVAARPVGMVAETLRQVQQVQSGGAPSQANARDDTTHLKKRGAALVRVSCKPEYQRRDVHPSFSHILDELLPDEARILRFMAVAGTQPSIDVRTKSLFQVGSVKLVGGVNMIAEMSGCKWPDRGYHYLANLNRLGLVDFSKEPVEDYRRYALLEVQPAATAAIARAPKSISTYRSIALTSFGRQFIDVCIDTDGYDGGGWATDGRQDKILGKGPRS